jgi:hypothetical protein
MMRRHTEANDETPGQEHRGKDGQRIDGEVDQGPETLARCLVVDLHEVLQAEVNERAHGDVQENEDGNSEQHRRAEQQRKAGKWIPADAHLFTQVDGDVFVAELRHLEPTERRDDRYRNEQHHR